MCTCKYHQVCSLSTPCPSPSYPGLQLVRQELQLSVGTSLAMQGNVVLEVDGRGSRGRGERWSRRLAEEGLGLADVEDQKIALRWTLLV